jgi:hypothetical protein
MCEPADQGWVHDCLAHASPGTQPTTRPSDLLSHLQLRGQALQALISQELNFPDNQKTAHFVGQTLLPLADRLNRLRVKIIYLVITKQDLKRLVVGGWGSQQFHYNRILDKIAFDGVVDISLDAVDGESIMPTPYLPEDAVDARIAMVHEDIGRTESGVADMVSREAQSTLQLSLAKFITEEAIAPLKLDVNEDWFPAGVIGYLSSEFMAVISGARPQDIVRMIARPDPDNPVAANSIDLSNPIPPDQLRQEIASAYGDAFRRRSITVVASWCQRAGPDAIKKTLAAIRATPPADDPALLVLIQKATGIDLTNELAPQ